MVLVLVVITVERAAVMNVKGVLYASVSLVVVTVVMWLFEVVFLSVVVVVVLWWELCGNSGYGIEKAVVKVSVAIKSAIFKWL